MFHKKRKEKSECNKQLHAQSQENLPNETFFCESNAWYQDLNFKYTIKRTEQKERREKYRELTLHN